MCIGGRGGSCFLYSCGQHLKCDAFHFETWRGSLLCSAEMCCICWRNLYGRWLFMLCITSTDGSCVGLICRVLSFTGSGGMAILANNLLVLTAIDVNCYAPAVAVATQHLVASLCNTTSCCLRVECSRPGCPRAGLVARQYV